MSAIECIDELFVSSIARLMTKMSARKVLAVDQKVL
jgi:hypothetical protein